ncbi:uncharacterized protein LOC135119621 [Zophobas morio]|uniref:uncharacterized protein LOC135119621 n=1 Tax=Zophobas morio TaxID=2755281 RepID=UPI003082F9CA
MQYPGYEQVPQQHYSMYPQDPYQQQIIQQQLYQQQLQQQHMQQHPIQHPPQPPHYRMPLQTENNAIVQADEEPLYVNAKQFARILKRREERSRLGRLFNIPQERMPYLHKSRHEHALRRTRGAGGRFTKKDASENNFNDGDQTSLMKMESTGEKGISKAKSSNKRRRGKTSESKSKVK